MAFEAITSAVLNALGSGNLTQALINNAISNKPASGLGSDDPHDMYNIQTQYAPGDIRYIGDQALLPNESVIPIDSTNQYTVPRTIPGNPLSQLMTTGALVGNALPGFKEDISQGWDALLEWMPERIEPQDWLPPGAEKAWGSLKNLFQPEEAAVLGAGTIIPFPPGGRKTPPSSGYYDPYERTDAAKRQLAIDAENNRRLRLVQNGGGRGYKPPNIKIPIPGAGAATVLVPAVAAALKALGGPTPVSDYAGDIPDYIGSQEDWNQRDQMRQWYEQAFIDPTEYNLAPYTTAQRQEALSGVQGAPEGFWGALQSRIADLIPGAEASVARDVEFERQQREPTWFPPTTESGSVMVEEPTSEPTIAPATFIGDVDFTPSFAEGGYTIAPSGPDVGDEEEEVSEERVVEIKKKPKEKRTSVEEQVVVASAVKKALSNASKGKKVKKELKAIVALAKVDPTIVKRYTTVGSRDLIDITSGVESYASIPKKKKAKPGYGKPPTRPGGR